MTKLEYEQAKMLVELKREIDKSEETINILENKLGASLRKIQDLKDETVKVLLPEAKLKPGEYLYLQSKEYENDKLEICFNTLGELLNCVCLEINSDGKTLSMSLEAEEALALAANLIKIATYKYE